MSADQRSPPFKTFQNPHMLKKGEKFYLDEETADVFFSFDTGDGQVTSVPAHRILLAASSDVFEAMLYGESEETGDVDVSEAAFKEFLQYFYLKEVKLTEGNIVGVVQLGQKYDVKKCIEDGIKFLTDILSRDNVWIAFNLAVQYDSLELYMRCEEYIILNTSSALKSDGFLECSKEVLERILKMKVLSCSEVEVFEACMAWTKAKSGDETLTRNVIEAHMGQLYYEIRFKSMTIQQFGLLTTKYESVLRSDSFTLMNIILQPEFQPDKFNKHPRQADWNADEVIMCDQALGDFNQWKSIMDKSQTTLSTNKPLLLGGFICNEIDTLGANLHPDLPVDMEIIESEGLNDANGTSTLQMKIMLQSKGTDILLPRPVLIRPGFFYTIRVGPFPNYYGFYLNGLTNEVHIDSGATVTFHSHDYSKFDNKIVALISSLKFNRF